MPFQNPHKFVKSISTSSSRKSSLNWRTQNKEKYLISEISSILLQRHNWAPLLQSQNLSSKLTPNLFLQILHKTQTNPQLSLNFFNWTTKNLGFQPDLKTHSKLTQILIRFGFSQPARPILDSLIQTYPTTQIVESLINSCKGTNCQSLVLSSVLDCYCNKGSYLQALEVYQQGKDHGHVVQIRGCNSLLTALEERNEIRIAWCFYASMLRNDVSVDQATWSIISRILRKDGKFERISRLVNMGIRNSVLYNILIECYSKEGRFKEAFEYLNEMCKGKITPGFSTYSSILEGACRCKDDKVIESVMNSMAEKGFVLSEYDSTIQKLCELGNTYTVDMIVTRATDEKIRLQDATYGCMLRAFSKEGRVEEAIRVYNIVLGNGITVKESCYNAFGNVICKENPSERISRLLSDLIKTGVGPCSSELSKFVSSLFDNRRWRESEELLDVIIENGSWPDALSCSSLMKYYCSCKRIDSAIELHNKMEKLGVCLDVGAYNVILDRLVKERRVDEALRVFDYMRSKNVVNSLSFTILISGLCGESEMKKAMQLHDEMLKMGLKPDAKTYKRLISGFK